MRQTFIGTPLFSRAFKRVAPIIDIKSKRSASYLTLSLSLFSLSFFGLFAIRPTLITAISLFKNVSDLKRINIEYENKIGSLIKAQSEFERIRDDLYVITNALPENSSFSKLAQAIEKFAEKENISIIQIRIDNVPISKVSSQNKLYPYSFDFVGSGEYSSIFAFISHLINYKRIINVNTIEFTSESGKVDNNNMRFSLKGITYYEP